MTSQMLLMQHWKTKERRTNSKGPKGLQLEVGAQRVPRLLVSKYFNWPKLNSALRPQIEKIEFVLESVALSQQTMVFLCAYTLLQMTTSNALIAKLGHYSWPRYWTNKSSLGTVSYFWRTPPLLPLGNTSEKCCHQWGLYYSATNVVPHALKNWIPFGLSVIGINWKIISNDQGSSLFTCYVSFLVVKWYGS